MPLATDSLHLDTALYYTFSTIAQTLAAAVSLLAVFIVFLFQTLNPPMAERAKELRDSEGFTSPEDKRGLDLLWKAGDFEALADKFRRTWGEPHLSRIIPALRVLDAYLHHKQAVMGKFTRAAVASSSVMVVSISTVALTPYLAQSDCLAAILLVGGAFSFAICLAMCVRVVRSALDKPVIPATAAGVEASTTGGAGEAGT